MNTSSFLVFIVTLITLGNSVQSDSDGEVECKYPADFYIKYSSYSSQDYFYNAEMGKCNIPIGTQCNRLINDLQQVNVTWSCPENSYCHEVRFHEDYFNRATCTCTHLYNPTEDNRGCTLGKLFGEACSLNEDTDESDCAKDAGLICEDEVCTCGDSDVIWSNETSTCIEKDCRYRGGGHGSVFADLEENCKLELEDSILRRDFARNLLSCPNNAHTKEFSYEDRRQNLVDDTTSYDASNSNDMINCVCNKGYHGGIGGRTCLPDQKYGEKCDRDSTYACNSDAGIYCRHKNDADDYFCGCETPEFWNEGESRCYSHYMCRETLGYSFYDTKQKKCSSEIHGTCDTTDPNGVCPKHASCRQISEEWPNNTTICICDEGFTSSADDRSCIELKQKGDACNDDNGNPCDPKSKLACLADTKVCGCDDSRTRWNVESNRCEVLAGEYCGNGRDVCVKNSECEYLRGRGYVCQCRNRYEESEDKLCLGRHLATCEINNDCHDGLICIDGSCKCEQPISQRYDDGSESCINLVGSACTQAGIDNTTDVDVCPENSACFEETCTCMAGFRKIPSGQCVSLNLKDASDVCTGVGECDFTKGLACIEKVCTCVDLALKYAPGTGCVAPKGSKCGWIEPVGTCSMDESDREGRKRCEHYHVSCGESAHCNYMGNGWSQCEMSSAPSIGGSESESPGTETAPPSVE